MKINNVEIIKMSSRAILGTRVRRAGRVCVRAGGGGDGTDGLFGCHHKFLKTLALCLLARV